MGDMKLGVIETRFAEIIWANAPLTTNQLNVISRFASKSLAERERSIKTRSKKELNP